MRKNYRSNVEDMINDIQETPSEGNLRLGVSDHVFSKKKQGVDKKEEKFENEKRIMVSPIEIAPNNENLEKNEGLLENSTEKKEEVLEKSAENEKNEEIIEKTEKYDDEAFNTQKFSFIFTVIFFKNQNVHILFKDLSRSPFFKSQSIISLLSSEPLAIVLLSGENAIEYNRQLFFPSQ